MVKVFMASFQDISQSLAWRDRGNQGATQIKILGKVTGLLCEPALQS